MVSRSPNRAKENDHPATGRSARHSPRQYFLIATLLRRHDFADFVALRRVFPSADQVVVASGNPVTIFNIKNHYRLITAIHHNRQAVFILRLLTHNEYDQAHWKKHL